MKEFYFTDMYEKYIIDIDERIIYFLVEIENCYQFRPIKDF